MIGQVICATSIVIVPKGVRNFKMVYVRGVLDNYPEKSYKIATHEGILMKLGKTDRQLSVNQYVSPIINGWRFKYVPYLEP